jgi:putative ABC transport system permease protein
MPFVTSNLRITARSLLRTPAFTAAAVLTLALGLGATTAIFSVVNGVLLEPLPYSQPERLVGIWFTFPGLGIPQAGTSDGTYFLYKRESQSFDGIGAYQDDAVNLDLGGGAEPERLTGADVTASLFPVLRVKPLIGRLISEQDDRPGQPRVAMIGEAMWRRKFGGDPSVIGRTIQIDSRPHEIIGIMPASFRFPTERAEVWMPLRLDPAHVQVAGFNYTTIARLKPGVTIRSAVTDLERTMNRLPELFPEVAPGMSTRDMMVKGRPRMLVHELRDDVVGDIGKVLWVILGTIGFVLLVACANVANLFLVRAEGRQRELAVRSALGAGRGEVTRRFIGEGVVLAITGGLLGVALAFGGLQLLVRFGGQNIPRITEVGIDLTTLAVAAVVTLLVALLCSAFPVLRFAGRDLSPLLRDGGRSATGGRDRQRARQLLVVSQVALALVLLTASGLMARSFWSLRAVRPGFDASHALSFRVSLVGEKYRERQRVAQFYEQAIEKIGALPGVQAVGTTTKLPLLPDGGNQSVLFIEGQEKPGDLPPVMLLSSASGGYFEASGIPIIAGRPFGRADGPAPLPEAVISQAIATKRFHDPTGRAALGARVRVSPGGQWYTIVGVAGDVRTESLEKPADEMAYFPLFGYDGQWDFTPYTMSFVIRTAGEPMAVAAAAQRAIHELEPSLPVFNVQPVEQVLRTSMARTSFTMLLLGIASAVAIVLGIVGIYGVVSYTVSLRTREIGVRIALGARPTQVGGMVARQGVAMAVIGIAAGLAGALILTRFLRALLFGVSPNDPLTLVGAAALLLASAFLASWLPARRAARVDPMSALRAD